MDERISVVGLGRLGLPLAASFADGGFETIGVDVRRDVVEAINSGISPIIEPGLQELISELGGTKLRATMDHAEAIDRTDITFVLVSTPSESDGTFSNRYVTSALKSLAEALRRSGKSDHVFVISSTVIPGSTDGTFIPLLEEHSGGRLNEDFHVCYNPDFVALGKVLSDFANPDFVLIGQSDASAGQRIASVYHRMCRNDPHIVQTSIINAEIIKVSLNAYMTIKIGFANTISQVCQKTPGADVDVVTGTLGLDSRISPFYFRGGLSYGGTCFPRDTTAFAAYAGRLGCDAGLIQASKHVNEQHNRYLSEFVLGQLSSAGEKTVSILGLAFKGDTPVITESPAVKLIDDLLNNGAEVTVYDKLAMDNTKQVFGDRIRYADSIQQCISSSAVCVITTPTDEFRHIDAGCIGAHAVRIIDCWRILEAERLGENVEYVPMGTGQRTKGYAGVSV